MEKLDEICHKFQNDGIAVLPSFMSAQECDELVSEMRKITEGINVQDHVKNLFQTESGNNDYFLTSGDKVRFFFDEPAVSKDKTLKYPVFQCLNKVGHALHMTPGVFQDIVTSERSKKILNKLGISQASVPQSMYIFKQAKFGSAVPPHQDSTFLHTSPHQTVIGFWVALEDATEDNGCLWFIPGSHKPYKTDKKVDKLDHAFMQRVTENGEVRTNYRLGKSREYYVSQDYRWVPAQVRKGDLVLIHDMVHHKSLPNNSDRSRNIFAWHLFDSGISTWDKTNWLQYPDGKDFMTFSTN